MTALDQYQRLEAPGIWREGADAQRIDVIVSFGDATLTISKDVDTAVAHWSLAAIERLNPGERPALFAPALDDPELLELADAQMIEAIEKVRKSLVRAGPHPRRLRMALSASAVAIGLGLALFWLPGAMNTYASTVVPPAKRAEIGEALLGEVERLTGAPCSTPLGDQALADLNRRLRPDATGRIVVLRTGAAPSRHLPGGIILLNRATVEDHEEPDAVAGFVLVEDARIAASDPLRDMLGRLGLVASLRLITTGQIRPAALTRYAEDLLASEPDPLPMHVVLTRFAAASVSSTTYAYAKDITGESTLQLIEADPVQPGSSAPVLDDGSWVSLQSICGG